MAHGGARKGAGRRKQRITEAIKNWAASILPDAEEREAWRDLLDDPKERPFALRFLSEHKHGKAAQSLKVEGGDEDSNPIKVLLIGAKSA